MIPSENARNEIKSLKKHELSKILKIYTQEEYRALRNCWMEVCTFTDFVNFSRQRHPNIPATSQDLYYFKTYFEKYHNMGIKHTLEDI